MRKSRRIHGSATRKRSLKPAAFAAATLARAQGTITARLEAASRAREQQDALLITAGIGNPSAVRGQLAGISDKIAQALDAAGGLKDPDELVKTLKARLNALF